MKTFKLILLLTVIVSFSFSFEFMEYKSGININQAQRVSFNKNIKLVKVPDHYKKGINHYDFNKKILGSKANTTLYF